MAAYDDIRVHDMVVLRSGAVHMVAGFDRGMPFRYGGYFGKQHFRREDVAGVFERWGDAYAARDALKDDPGVIDKACVAC